MITVQVGDSCNFKCTVCERPYVGETMFALMTTRHCLATLCWDCSVDLRDTMVNVAASKEPTVCPGLTPDGSAMCRRPDGHPGTCEGPVPTASVGEAPGEPCGVPFDDGGPTCTLPKGHDLHAFDMLAPGRGSRTSLDPEPQSPVADPSAATRRGNHSTPVPRPSEVLPDGPRPLVKIPHCALCEVARQNGVGCPRHPSEDEGARTNEAESKDCPEKPGGYECALAAGHLWHCMPLYQGVPIGDAWSPKYKEWARANFAARCSQEHQRPETARPRDEQSVDAYRNGWRDAVEACAREAEQTQPTMMGYGGTHPAECKSWYEPNPYARACAANIRKLATRTGSTAAEPAEHVERCIECGEPVEYVSKGRWTCNNEECGTIMQTGPKPAPKRSVERG